MTKEHKKMYKAGKNWIAATITVATVAVFGGLATLNAHADSTTQGSQSNNVNEKQSVNNSKSISQADRYNLTTAGSNNQSSENNNANSQSNMNNGSQTTTASTPDENSDGLDPNIYGTVNVEDWDYQENNHILNLTNYHGQDKDHIIIPNLNDFSNANIDINGVEGIGITSQVLKNALGQLNSQNSTIAISKTSGSFSNKVIAENNNWGSAFVTPKQIKIKYADLTNLDTSNVTNMGGMFYNAIDLQSVGDLSKWNTSNVTSMNYMFNNARNLQSVGDLSKWDTSNVTDMGGMFDNAINLQSVGDLSKWDTSRVTDMNAMFDSTRFSSIGDLSNWNTSNVTNMSDMFCNAINLQSVGDLSKWDTSRVTDMNAMFDSTRFSSIGDLSNWNTSNVTNMSDMFCNAINLQSVGDLSKWDTSRVTDMNAMFDSTRFSSIGDLSKWNTSNVTDMSYMFADTINLQSVGDLSKWDTSNVTNMRAVLLNSKINYFEVSRYNNSFNNTLYLIDSKGLMGQPDATIATIKAPTFYKIEPGKNENQSVYDTVLPLVQKKANEEYKNFLNGLTEGMRNIYPTKVTLKMVISEKWSPTPANNANATFTYNMKIGTLKDVVINYVDKVRNIVGSETLIGIVGSTISLPKKLSLPSGYQLVKGQDIPSTITIQKGKLQTIDIYVEKSPEVPVIKTGTINYIDPDGKVVKTDQVSGKVGDKVDVKLSLPDGYELANKDEHIPSVITVTENGIGTINVNVKKINTTNTGWNQQGDDWLYMQKNGYLAKGWNYLNGHWFYFDLQSGIMKTGIQSIGNSFYYLNAQHDGTYGAMKTSWQFVNGHWIGLQGSGNAYVGWQAINGHWYYFDPQTAYALTNWQNINNHWYYFDPTNAWAQTGWFKSGAGYWYFFDYANAWALTNWAKLNNHWYYFDNINANALTGWQSINSHWYYFDPTNAWARTGWQWIHGHWYWFDEANAWALTGWQYYRGQWYFMDQQNAWMDTGWTTNLANGQLYYLDKNGHPLTGWQRSLNGLWYYLQPGSDAAAIGWNWINGHWYYFNPEETIKGTKAKGAMFTGRHFIDNRWNRFDLNGHWLG